MPWREGDVICDQGGTTFRVLAMRRDPVTQMMLVKLLDMSVGEELRGVFSTSLLLAAGYRLSLGHGLLEDGDAAAGG